MPFEREAFLLFQEQRRVSFFFNEFVGLVSLSFSLYPMRLREMRMLHGGPITFV